ncbi:DUF4153 domain-containing protein [Pararhodobacter sp.]|uniref:DUF4153 domain-containing protein n=1 Tax=Pararhodobacter sp. TaxID=2127056 RepID=UPI002FDFD041
MQTRISPLARLAALIFLVLLGDWLFWHQDRGLSLALFVFAIFAAASWSVRPLSRLVGPGLLLLAAVLPVIEMLQALSLAFLAAGLVLALAWVHGPLSAAPGYALSLPGRWLAPLNPARNLRALRALPAEAGTIRRQLALWAFPLGGSAVFIALLMDANPVLSQLFSLDLDLFRALKRGLFWAGIALMVAPFLTPAPVTASLQWRLPGSGLSGGSVIRALILFNLVIGLQTLTDLSILVAGADLPEGMSFADYAHRGAYPLLVTAMLAGAFALAARPFLSAHPAIKPLLGLWLGQNMVLCGAAALRLDLYIEAYGLTYLRLHALIWMGLVVAGLGLCLWQVLARRGNRWLLLRAGGLGLVTLYVACFVNFAGIIAAQNLSHPNTDPNYVCDLGPMASLAWAEAANPPPPGFRLGSCGARHAPVTRGWRDWGFRAWRLRHNLAALEAAR